jgi:hypothetical protein
MNKPLKWGLGFLVGVFIGNVIWLYVLDAPEAKFFTGEWWQLWAAAYCVAVIAIVIGVVRSACRDQSN